MIKTLQKVGIEGTYFNIKAIYIYKTNPQLTSFSTAKSWKHSLSDQEQDKGAHSPLLFNIVLEVLAAASRQEKEIQGIWIGKEVKLSLFTNDMKTLKMPPENY